MTWRVRGEPDRFGLLVFACDQCHRLAAGYSEREASKSPCVCRTTSAPRVERSKR